MSKVLNFVRRNASKVAIGSGAVLGTLALAASNAFATPPDLSTQAQSAADGGTAIVNAATTAFQGVWPVILGLIALVFLGFWIVARVKKGANGAK